MLRLHKNKKIFYFLSSVFIFILLFQFNNCNSFNSQINRSLSSTSQNLTVARENQPVDPNNSYVLQCITSSDGKKISTQLLHSTTISNNVVTAKIDSLDWNQDEDLIVTLNNNCLKRNNYTDSILQFVEFKNISHRMPLTTYVIKKQTVKNLKLFINVALSSACLMSAEKNQKIKKHGDTLDPQFSDQIQLSSIGMTPSYIDSVHNYAGLTPYKTKVAVIDTGVDTQNPDLINSFARDTSGNIQGYNSTGNTTEFTDMDFHGTHVAGLIAAGYKNGVMGSGVWGRNIELYPIRVFEIDEDGEVSATASSVANGIIWATTRNVDIINLSLGTPADSKAIKDAISFAISNNVTVITAAGNDGAEINSSNPQYPAMYSNQFEGLITVSSIDAVTNIMSSFSNYSSTYVDIFAPGSNSVNGILSTVPLSFESSGFSSKYQSGSKKYPIQGTSMATPLVTGALSAAISISKSRGVRFTNAQLESFLVGDGSPKNLTYSTYVSKGSYLNLPYFLNYIANQINEVEITKPTTSSISITTQPTAKQIVLGESTELSVGVSSQANPTFQWYFNGILISGATSSKLSLNQVTEDKAGVYHVEVSNGTQRLVSQHVNIKVALKYCQ